jgi:hypothetical protein
LISSGSETEFYNYVVKWNCVSNEKHYFKWGKGRLADGGPANQHKAVLVISAQLQTQYHCLLHELLMHFLVFSRGFHSPLEKGSLPACGETEVGQ